MQWEESDRRESEPAPGLVVAAVVAAESMRAQRQPLLR